MTPKKKRQYKGYHYEGDILVLNVDETVDGRKRYYDKDGKIHVVTPRQIDVETQYLQPMRQMGMSIQAHNVNIIRGDHNTINTTKSNTYYIPNNQPVQPQAKRQWVCVVCHEQNDDTASICEACGTKREWIR